MGILIGYLLMTLIPGIFITAILSDSDTIKKLNIVGWILCVLFGFSGIVFCSLLGLIMGLLVKICTK